MYIYLMLVILCHLAKLLLRLNLFARLFTILTSSNSRGIERLLHIPLALTRFQQFRFTSTVATTPVTMPRADSSGATTTTETFGDDPIVQSQGGGGPSGGGGGRPKPSNPAPAPPNK
jgi:uncharacterized membrane protein YgcG